MEVEGIIDAGIATAPQVPGGAAPVQVEEDIAPVEGIQHLPSDDADMAERTPNKPDMPAAPAAQQREHEPPSEPTFVRRALNQVYHFYMRIARPQLTAVQQGNYVRDTVKDVIGDNLPVLAGQVTTKIFSGWTDIIATMPGYDYGQLKGICTRLEESGIRATNGKIQDIGTASSCTRGSTGRSWHGGCSRTCRSA